MSDIAGGTHEDTVTKLTDAAITDRNLLGKFGTDVDHVAVCGASDRPIGVIEDEASAAELPVSVAMLGGAKRTRRCVASEIIAHNSEIFTAADGKVQNTPTDAGTYYRVGIAMTAAEADGDEIEFMPQVPIEYVVAA